MTTSDVTTSPATSAAADREADRPRLAEGVDLVGVYEGSGYKDPPYLVHRADGQMIQLPPILFFVAEGAAAGQSFDGIAASVSQKAQRGLSGDDVRYLIEKKLRPLGVVLLPGDGTVDVDKPDPFLALRFRVGFVNERVTNRLAAVFQPLFWPPILFAVLSGFVALDIWLFSRHGIGEGVRRLLNEPATIVLFFALVITSAAFHELGHAAACRYGGARPGNMGAGLYVVWPAFYTDVSDAYRLDRRGRLRTDLGGVYFNIVFALATFAAYLLTGFEPLLVVIGFQHFEMLHQMLPFLRLDGYYILADATGVPDLFARIKPILRSLIPGRDGGDQVDELKRWVRLVVTGWVLTVVPLLLYLFTMTVIAAPRIFATAADSISDQVATLGSAISDADALAGLASAVQIFALALPLVAITVTVARLVLRVTTGLWSWSDDHPLRRGGVIGSTALAAGFALFVLWPNGDYQPIRPGERFAVQDSIRAIGDIPTGKPSVATAATPPDGSAPSATTGDSPATEGTATTSTTSTTTEPESSTTSEGSSSTTSSTSTSSTSTSSTSTTSTTSTTTTTSSSTTTSTP